MCINRLIVKVEDKMLFVQQPSQTMCVCVCPSEGEKFEPPVFIKELQDMEVEDGDKVELIVEVKGRLHCAHWAGHYAWNDDCLCMRVIGVWVLGRPSGLMLIGLRKIVIRVTDGAK